MLVLKKHDQTRLLPPLLLVFRMQQKARLWHVFPPSQVVIFISVTLKLPFWISTLRKCTRVSWLFDLTIPTHQKRRYLCPNPMGIWTDSHLFVDWVWGNHTGGFETSWYQGWHHISHVRLFPDNLRLCDSTHQRWQGLCRWHWTIAGLLNQ